MRGFHDFNIYIAMQKLTVFRYLWRGICYPLAGLVTGVALYMLMALLLGVLPWHSDYQPDGAPVLIYLETNGVHADLVLPARNEVVDWTRIFPAQQNRAGRQPDGADAVSIGWGEREFFLETPNWGDLRASTALSALSGLNSTLLHVTYQRMPRTAGADRVALTLSRDNYRRLVDYIRQTSRLDARGNTVWLPGRGYTTNDAFYEANGRYTMFRTCNEWVREGLGVANVRVPWWSPFDKALFWQLRGD